MKKFLMSIVFSLFFTLQLQASNVGFAEASMEYYRDNPDLEHFTIDWNADKHLATLTLRLTWMNYTDIDHGGGYNLNSGFKPYLASPDLLGECKLTSIDGSLDRPSLQPFYEVKLLLKGKDCPSNFKTFDYLGIRASKYNVEDLADEFYTINFHLWVFEAP